MDEVTDNTVAAAAAEVEIKVSDLEPGDVLISEVDAARYVFIGRMAHPLFPGLQMVIWWKWEKGYVFDALSLDQRLPMTRQFRYRQDSDKQALLRLAILTWQQSGASLR